MSEHSTSWARSIAKAWVKKVLLPVVLLAMPVGSAVSAIQHMRTKGESRVESTAARRQLSVREARVFRYSGIPMSLLLIAVVWFGIAGGATTAEGGGRPA